VERFVLIATTGKNAKTVKNSFFRQPILPSFVIRKFRVPKVEKTIGTLDLTN